MQKKLVNKLLLERSENINEVKMAKITLAEHENEYEDVFSCTLYIVLFSIIFTINIGIYTYFIYLHKHIKYINSSKTAVNNKDGFCIQTFTKHIKLLQMLKA